MKRLWVAATAISLAMPIGLRAQTMEYMVSVGERVRLRVTDSVLPSPDARPGELSEIIGTVVEIASDTIWLEPSPNDRPVAVPRILIYTVEKSLRRGRARSMGNAALVGGGLSAIVASALPEDLQVPVFLSGFALGALVGVLLGSEGWTQAWIPECLDIVATGCGS